MCGPSKKCPRDKGLSTQGQKDTQTHTHTFWIQAVCLFQKCVFDSVVVSYHRNITEAQTRGFAWRHVAPADPPRSDGGFSAPWRQTLILSVLFCCPSFSSKTDESLRWFSLMFSSEGFWSVVYTSILPFSSICKGLDGWLQNGRLKEEDEEKFGINFSTFKLCKHH